MNPPPAAISTSMVSSSHDPSRPRPGPKVHLAPYARRLRSSTTKDDRTAIILRSARGPPPPRDAGLRDQPPGPTNPSTAVKKRTDPAAAYCLRALTAGVSRRRRWGGRLRVPAVGICGSAETPMEWKDQPGAGFVGHWLWIWPCFPGTEESYP